MATLQPRGSSIAQPVEVGPYCFRRIGDDSIIYTLQQETLFVDDGFKVARTISSLAIILGIPVIFVSLALLAQEESTVALLAGEASTGIFDGAIADLCFILSTFPFIATNGSLSLIASREGIGIRSVVSKCIQ